MGMIFDLLEAWSAGGDSKATAACASWDECGVRDWSRRFVLQASPGRSL